MNNNKEPIVNMMVSVLLAVCMALGYFVWSLEIEVSNLEMRDVSFENYLASAKYESAKRECSKFDGKFVYEPGPNSVGALWGSNIKSMDMQLKCLKDKVEYIYSQDGVYVRQSITKISDEAK